MECNETKNHNIQTEEPTTEAGVNPVILDYYKKIGWKSDLEQFFSLSTAESEVRDITSLYWRRMKSQDSSDTSEKNNESCTELCRISIKCAIPEASSSSQDDNTRTKSDSESPPIITEDGQSRHTDDESMNDDNLSQRSIDAILDSSTNRPQSPTSSITSQRKLEWDSLADVGYANESDRKTSASSLSTLERLALKQQYTINDSKPDSDIGQPTAHSTPVDNDNKSKSKKGAVKKTTKFYKKDVDIVEVNLPNKSDTDPSQGISVNLTKHISFNMDKNGEVTVENISNDLNVTPDKRSIGLETSPLLKTDKEIQTSLTKVNDASVSPDLDKFENIYNLKTPGLISLNTVRRKYRRKKPKLLRKKIRNKKINDNDKENIPVQEKSNDQVSAAESFEYLPGHIYNQNQLKLDQPGPSINVEIKSSSQDSCGAVTTDSSKDSKQSFTRDLERGVEFLTVALNKKNYNNSELKDKLVKEIVRRLLKSKYRDDDSATEFLSGLGCSSKKVNLGESRMTTSTSDTNTESNNKQARPQKSILRLDKFNSNVIASISQSAPNLPSVLGSENKTQEPPVKQRVSNTESDSSRGKHSSDTAFAKTSSEELYQKYLEALRREEAYKQHLRSKEMFLKKKLVSSDTAFKPHLDIKTNTKLRDLIKDLTRNNYDDGSGDASKLEGGVNPNPDAQNMGMARSQRSHSVFTLSSGNSDDNKKGNLKKRLQKEIKQTNSSYSRNEHRCFCTHHFIAPKVGVTDSSVQVNINNSTQDKNPTETDRGTEHNIQPCNLHKISQGSLEKLAHVISDNVTGDIKYVCLCNQKCATSQEVPNSMLIYKCSRLIPRDLIEDTTLRTGNVIDVQCIDNCQSSHDEKIYSQSTSEIPKVNKNNELVHTEQCDEVVNSENKVALKGNSKSSQTNLALKAFLEGPSNEGTVQSTVTEQKCQRESTIFKQSKVEPISKKNVHEATRCIQTEISIDPKISDPSLSDIHLISDQDSAKLICEEYKQDSEQMPDNDGRPVIQVNSNNDINNKGLDKIVVEIGNEPKIEPQMTSYAEPSNKDIPLDTEYKNNEVEFNVNNKKNNVMDDYTIPIQGTNMTLMVRIGSNSGQKIKSSQKDDIKSDYWTGTEKPEVAEKGTCLTEECSKGVQSYATDIFTQIIQDSPDSNFVSEDLTKEKSIPRKQAALRSFYRNSQNNLTAPDGHSNTYPKDAPLKPKPFLRSNTDTGKFVQTDIVKKTDAIVQDIYKSSSTLSKNTGSKKSESNNAAALSTERSYKATVGSSKENKNTSSNTDTDTNIQSSKSSIGFEKDPILDIIKDITKRYSKQDIDKNKKKKCFKEIIKVLNYLLDTEEGTDIEDVKFSDSASTDSNSRKYSKHKNNMIEQATKNVNGLQESRNDVDPKLPMKEKPIFNEKTEQPKNIIYNQSLKNNNPKVNLPQTVDKAVQSSIDKPNIRTKSTESSEIPATTEFPGTSSDSATCKVLNKIKRECDKYHQKRCKSRNSKKCEASSSTSVKCDQCKRVHYCPCRAHRGQQHKCEKTNKKCVAYNLIIQTSDSMISEDTTVDRNSKPLKNVIVKLPHKREHMVNAPFKEVFTKIEKILPHSPRDEPRMCRSRSWPNESEMSSMDNYTKTNCGYTVREYLEINRPDFVEKCSSRQQCLKRISEKRANESSAQRHLLSVQLDQRPSLTSLSETELRRLAKDLGVELKRKKLAPKFVSEREMKKHSERIYKSLPEVVQKKEEAKKENVKKTNLLMANMFRKNLQKKTLRGSVNLSNYSTVIKI